MDFADRHFHGCTAHYNKTSQTSKPSRWCVNHARWRKRQVFGPQTSWEKILLRHKLEQGLQGLQKRAFSKNCDCWPAHKKRLVHGEEIKLLLFWLFKKVHTSWAPVMGVTEMYIFCGEKSRGVWKRTCCSSWTSSVSHRSQMVELLWFRVAVSKRRVWTRNEI